MDKGRGEKADLTLRMSLLLLLLLLMMMTTMMMMDENPLH